MSKRNLIFILVAATFIAYFSSFSNPFIWDDEQFITSNVYVQNFDIGKIFTTNTVAGAGVQSNYYRPLTTLSFAVDFRIWGLNSFGFHLTNFFLHLGAGIVLFLLLIELFSLYKPSTSSGKKSSLSEQSESKGISLPAFFISLFFLIHPIQTEAVIYINSRGDSMYALFLFTSLWLFVRGLAHPVIPAKAGIQERTGSRIGVRDDNKKLLISISVVATFVASLLSKEIALAGLGLYILVWIYDLRFKIQDAKYKIPNTKYALWAIGGIVLVVITYLALRLTILNFANLVNFYGFENEYTRSLAIRLFTFCKVLWVYVGLLVWPNPLHMERTVDLVKSFWSPWVLGAVGLVGGVGLVGWMELRKNKTTWILFGLAWFLTMLVPSSGIIPINGILYEHWLYTPMIGVWIMLYGIIQGVRGKGQGERKKFFGLYPLPFTLYPLLIIFVILLSIMYLFLTIRQNNLWADPITFYTYTLSFAPDSARLHNNLGMTLANNGKVKEAIPEYEKALALGYEYPQVYNNLGNAQIATGDYENAEKNLRKALQLAPNFTTAKLNLIKLYVTSKQWDKALELAQGDQALIQEIGKLRSQ